MLLHPHPANIQADEWTPNMILNSTDGQDDLPRYFARVMGMATSLRHGRIDFILPDGRHFRAEGAKPAYLDGWWSTPDLQAFMDFIHADNEDIYDGFPGMGLVRMYEQLRFWFQRNSKGQARKNISYHYDLGNDFYKLWLDETMSYSSAIFTDPQQSMEAAQIEKYKSIKNNKFFRCN